MLVFLNAKTLKSLRLTFRVSSLEISQPQLDFFGSLGPGSCAIQAASEKSFAPSYSPLHRLPHRTQRFTSSKLMETRDTYASLLERTLLLFFFMSKAFIHLLRKQALLALLFNGSYFAFRRFPYSWRLLGFFGLFCAACCLQLSLLLSRGIHTDRALSN